MNLNIKAIENLVDHFNAGNINEEDFFRRVQSFVNEGMDEIRRHKAYNIKNEIKAGDTVKINHKKVYGRTFRIKEVKRVKAVVVNPINEFESFIVPLSLIEKA
jgi:hypothetical protein